MATPQLIRSVNPATEEVIATFEPATPAQIEQALRDAGQTRESLEVMKKLQKDLPQWKRANSPRAQRRS